MGVIPIQSDEITFQEGDSLGGGRYRLIRKQSSQQWTSDIYEIAWEAQDLQGEILVMICELGLPTLGVAARQSHLRTAMRAFVQFGRYSLLQSLTNVFRERGRDFLVFEKIAGETLLARMQRTGQFLKEQEVIEGCLQITQVLEAVSVQDVPLIHGSITPVHIVITQFGQWVPINFSIVLASGALPSQNFNPSWFPPFIAPEFTKGIIASSSDLYALLATAYFALTGNLLMGTGNMPNRQPLVSNISPSFGNVLKKGLNPTATRYLQISALHQDLLALRPAGSTPASHSGPLREKSVPLTPQKEEMPSLSEVRQSTESKTSEGSSEEEAQLDSIAHVLSSLASSDEHEKPAMNVLPLPEELPPIPQENAAFVASLVMGSILFCSLLPIFIK